MYKQPPIHSRIWMPTHYSGNPSTTPKTARDKLRGRKEDEMYRYLSSRLKLFGIRQYDLGTMLGLKAPAVSQRFTGKIPWDINEMYKVLEVCRDTPDKLHLYFPKDGMDCLFGKDAS